MPQVLDTIPPGSKKNQIDFSPVIVSLPMSHMSPRYPSEQPSRQVPLTLSHALCGPPQLGLHFFEQPAPYVLPVHSVTKKNAYVSEYNLTKYITMSVFQKYKINGRFAVVDYSL